ncbi:MAG: glycoside hydrolase family 13 protein [Lutimonas sp.]
MRIEPPNWWVGMNHGVVQLMVHDENIAAREVSISDADVVILETSRTENPNYLFIDLDLTNVKSSKKIPIKFTQKGKKDLVYAYEIKERESDALSFKGFDVTDVIYLITPDRFANGDTSNDMVKGLRETKINRNDDYGRHGGDLKGITDHLDYIEDMGFTAIWPTPVLINDMKSSSYHGYAITDLYKVDPRFGTTDEYIELSRKAREKGIKLIMDQVANHIGSEHWWMKDLPTKDWVNFQDEFLEDSTVVTNHRRTVNQDFYASEKDKKLMSEGWFVPTMPDMNQKNPLLAKYLIQNSLWWIETLQLGGIRQDTYPYPDKDFMSDWAGAIMKEYPNFSIVGEEWSYNPLLVGYWQQGAQNKDGYQSNLTSTMDFPMQKAIVDGLNEKESWDTGLVKIYEGLANDFSYAYPEKIMAFMDNHDMDRVFTQLKEDPEKLKMALGYLLALPRIPQIYYGTEVLIENSKKPGDHGLIRTDFPGGWKDDSTNAFTGKGLSQDQLDMQSFLKKVLLYRKNSVAIHRGRTVHFGPDKGVYTLFRIFEDETYMVILNKNENPIELDTSRFEEIGLDGKTVKDIISGSAKTWPDSLKIQKQGITLLTTKLN